MAIILSQGVVANISIPSQKREMNFKWNYLTQSIAVELKRKYNKERHWIQAWKGYSKKKTLGPMTEPLSHAPGKIQSEKLTKKKVEMKTLHITQYRTFSLPIVWWEQKGVFMWSPGRITTKAKAEQHVVHLRQNLIRIFSLNQQQ